MGRSRNSTAQPARGELLQAGPSGVRSCARTGQERGHDHAVDLAALDHGVAQAVEPRPRERCPGVAVVAEDVLVASSAQPAASCARMWDVQALELLLNGLVLDLAARRDADVERHPHWLAHAPSLGTPAPRSARMAAAPPTARGVGTPGPSAAGRLLVWNAGSAGHDHTALLSSHPPLH